MAIGRSWLLSRAGHVLFADHLTLALYPTGSPSGQAQSGALAAEPTVKAVLVPGLSVEPADRSSCSAMRRLRSLKRRTGPARRTLRVLRPQLPEFKVGRPGRSRANLDPDLAKVLLLKRQTKLQRCRLAGPDGGHGPRRAERYQGALRPRLHLPRDQGRRRRAARRYSLPIPGSSRSKTTRRCAGSTIAARGKLLSPGRGGRSERCRIKYHTDGAAGRATGRRLRDRLPVSRTWAAPATCWSSREPAAPR
jgi:hypothetical protein